MTDNHNPAENFLDCRECQHLIIVPRESLSALTSWVLASGTKGLVGDNQTMADKWVILFDKMIAMRNAFHPDWHQAISYFLLKDRPKNQTKQNVNFLTDWLRGGGDEEITSAVEELQIGDKETGSGDQETQGGDKTMRDCNKEILNKVPRELKHVTLLNLGRFMSLISEMDKKVEAQDT